MSLLATNKTSWRFGVIWAHVRSSFSMSNNEGWPGIPWKSLLSLRGPFGVSFRFPLRRVRIISTVLALLMNQVPRFFKSSDLLVKRSIQFTDFLAYRPIYGQDIFDVHPRLHLSIWNPLIRNCRIPFVVVPHPVIVTICVPRAIILIVPHTLRCHGLRWK